MLRCRKSQSVVALLLLLNGGVANAHKSGSAAVAGALTLDRTRAGIGETVTVQLKVAATADIPTLHQRIFALHNCALEVSGTNPALVENVKQTSVIVTTARYRVTQEAPCVIGAEVVSQEGVDYRFASMFSATVNPGLPVHDKTHPGTMGDGRPTAVFPPD